MTGKISYNNPRIYYLEKMNTEQIRSLDRNKTAVLIPGGVLEEHDTGWENRKIEEWLKENRLN